MKLRIWNVWLFVSLLEAIISFALLFIVVNAAADGGNYSSVSSYIIGSFVIDILLGFFTLIATKIAIRIAVRDSHLQYRFRFWSAGLFALVIATVNLVKSVEFDVEYFRAEAALAQISGDQLLGHAGPAFTIFYFLLGVFYFILFLFIGIGEQISYGKKRKKAEQSGECVVSK